MKKFLGLILLSFFWFNIVIAECQKGDCVNGEGTYSFSDDMKYIGEFQLGQFHGQGTLLSYGDKYVGEFKEGNYHGDGILTYSNGDKYVGEFQLGQFHGQGTFTDSNGNVKEGRWTHNVLEIKKAKTKNYESTNVVAENKKTKIEVIECYEEEWWGDCVRGKIIYADGSKYEGELKDGKRHGKGRYTSGGITFFTDWINDEDVHETMTSTKKNNSASSKKSICSVNRSLFCSAQRVLDICGTYENESAYNSCMYRFEEIGNTLERTYGLTNNEFVMGVTSCKC